MRYIVLFSILILSGCQRFDYEALEKRELASGVRHDKLFQGLYLGMTRDEFRARCFKLNQDSVFTDGVAAKVRYKIKELSSPATILFFPDFKDEKIYQLPVTIQYDAWAPWNKNLNSSVLLADVKNMLMKWYGGNSFAELKTDGKPPVWVKVDGNRRITILANDEAMIKVLYKDLTVKTE